MRPIRVALVLAAALCFLAGSLVVAQTPQEKFDADLVAKIKEEGLKRSQVMETISYLTDVHGPRLTGSPQIRAAGQWAVSKMTEWKMANAHLEPWGPFGRGWSLERFRADMVAPSYSQLIAYPKAWSPSTPKTIRGTPLFLDAADEKQLDEYRGKLHRAIVLISPPREVKALFDAPARRQTDEALLALANSDGTYRGFRSQPPGPQAASPPAPMPTPGGPPSATPEQRSALQLLNRKWQLIYEEGAAFVLEPGRGDGGTVFLAAATLPRQRDASVQDRQPQAENDQPATPENRPGDNPYSRGPRPWAGDSPEIVPQAVVAVEHYNRIVRMLKKGVPVELEFDLLSRYHTDDQMSFNVIGEIPGSDLAHEIVMLGGHLDSWHSGTGATDNAVGCGVALEAVRILQAIGAKPRRTIRLALWTGEEQGLLGSRAYVAEHFGRAIPPERRAPMATAAGAEATTSTAGGNGAGSDAGQSQPPAGGPPRRERPPSRYELKPGHEKFCAYFNLDNGTGKIRGIYLQGNEAVRPIFRAWLSPFADMGASTITLANTRGTDHLSFDGIGLPGFQFIQDPLEYDSRTHHSSMDVYDRVQEEDMKQAAIIMAAFVHHAAMRDEKLPRKPLVGEVVNTPPQQQ